MVDGVGAVLSHEQKLRLRDDKYDHLNARFHQLSRASRVLTKRLHNDKPNMKPYAPVSISCINSMKLGTP